MPWFSIRMRHIYTVENSGFHDIWYSTRIVKANSENEAVHLAVELGKKKVESSYKNSDNDVVACEFAGLTQVVNIGDELSDGSVLDSYEYEFDNSLPIKYPFEVKVEWLTPLENSIGDEYDLE